MSNFKYCFEVDNIIRNLEAKDKKEVFEILVNNILNVQFKKTDDFSLQKKDKKEIKKIFLNEFLEREKLGSTGLQFGISIPHIKTNLIDNISFAVGIHPRGLDFNSLDKLPSKIIILSIVPSKQAQVHLNFLSVLSRALFQENNRKLILKTKKNIDIYNFILQKLPKNE